MGKYQKCPICDRLDNMETHKCYPIWMVRVEGEHEEDARPIHAIDAEEAAENFAKEYDEPYFLNHEDMVIVTLGNGEQLKFEVRGEAIPTYCAMFIKD